MTIIMNFFMLIFKVVTLPLQLMEAVGIYGIYKRFFPFLVYKISFTYNKKMHDKKKDLFSNLSEFTLCNGPLRVLEIGYGSGVVCTDPSPHSEKYLQKSLAVNDHLMFENFVPASGEDIGAVKNESMDVVLVLCSVNDKPRTLQEAHRILRPVYVNFRLQLYFFQDVLQPIWYYFGDGCEVVRATWKDLEATGFSELKLRHHSTS
uniref:Methyltransferase type 11 domain-containing protein n=1 Tax=Hucho hucho TaxID=62062 RepID=A0A4W5R4Y6_9TELE